MRYKQKDLDARCEEMMVLIFNKKFIEFRDMLTEEIEEHPTTEASILLEQEMQKDYSSELDSSLTIFRMFWDKNSTEGIGSLVGIPSFVGRLDYLSKRKLIDVCIEFLETETLSKENQSYLKLHVATKALLRVAHKTDKQLFEQFREAIKGKYDLKVLRDKVIKQADKKFEDSKETTVTPAGEIILGFPLYTS